MRPSISWMTQDVPRMSVTRHQSQLRATQASRPFGATTPVHIGPRRAMSA